MKEEKKQIEIVLKPLINLEISFFDRIYFDLYYFTYLNQTEGEKENKYFISIVSPYNSFDGFIHPIKQTAIFVD